MTKAEVALLLAKAAAFDTRTVAAADVEAWYEAVGHLSYAVASAAATEHYRTSRYRLTPYDLLRIVERHRREAAERQFEADERKARTMAAAEHNGQRHPAGVVVATTDRSLPPVYVEARKRLGSPSAGAVLEVPCEWCGAGKGQPCTVPGWTDRPRRQPHATRFQAAGIPEPDDDIYRRLARVQRTGTTGDTSAA